MRVHCVLQVFNGEVQSKQGTGSGFWGRIEMIADCWNRFVEVSSALLTPEIGALTAYIAWQQLKTAKDKLKLDLFERRFAVYDQMRQALYQVVSDARVTDETWKRIVRAEDEALLLFPDEVLERFKWIGEYAGKAVSHREERTGLPQGSKELGTSIRDHGWYISKLISETRGLPKFIQAHLRIKP